ncbi:DUF177 domain-containing protein [Microvirgula aerodenitrificans]|uniref:Large ribosomal RNA subunit accumulation protein YceD n=1 Tax=Microvirgula aerodenitrificans TaxID=57480 RepID=A0A2S0PA75_9NEIS|nr:YceD family protein [Microvirgula aerodenitrificans]AVY94289.1 metal-binding protein [Microvirgula aerodenitrificans]
MSQPILINSLDFARERREISTRDIAVADLPRLADALASRDGVLSWSVSGHVDRLHRPTLRLKVRGDVMLACQRCLEPLPHRIDADTLITQFTDEERLEAACDEDEDLDGILAEEELDVLALIEDEVLLGLPLAPRHDDCRPDAIEKAKADKPNPFAVLAALKRKPD